jgi:PAS domain S-box-containing protein
VGSVGRSADETMDLRYAFERAQRRLAEDFGAVRLLYEVGEGCIRSGNNEAENIAAILDAAITVMGADKANIQLVDPPTGELVIAAQRGFEAPFLRFFERVGADDRSACGAALAAAQPVIVEDVEDSEVFRGQASLAVLREAGVRAVLSIPLVCSTGGVLGMISAHFAAPHRPSPQELGLMNLLARQGADYVERKQAERMLREVSADLRQILDTTDIGLTRCSRDLRYLSANAAYARMTGLPPERIVGRPIVEVMGEEAFAVIRPHVERVLSGERVQYEAELPFAAGAAIWASVVYTPSRDQEDAVTGWLASVSDITERKRHEERQQLLLHELDHRVKNTLATVQSLARQTLHNAENLTEGHAALEARLIALSRAHDVLTRERWEGAQLRELIGGALSAYRGADAPNRFEIDGPEVSLVPKAALALSLALHELATNAAKYGALAGETGRVRLEWSLSREEERGFRLCWTESGGPMVREPMRRGFGSRLIERALARDIGGDVRLTFAPEGLSCLIAAPANEITSRI